MAGEREEALGRVTARDVEVLEFVARYGVVPRDAVALWAQTARTMTWRRERRLREAGLLEIAKPHSGEVPFLLATRDGLSFCTRDELPVAEISLASLGHFAAIARLAARLERAGETLISERELLAHERAFGERTFSVRLANGTLHRPDLISIPPWSTAAQWGRAVPTKPIEVELVQKGARRLDRILAGWRGQVRAGRFPPPRYYCSATALPYVQRSAERVGFGAEFEATLLPAECLPATLLF
jgi:hypothetical protein